jgi:hypothetical protein
LGLAVGATQHFATHAFRVPEQFARSPLGFCPTEDVSVNMAERLAFGRAERLPPALSYAEHARDQFVQVRS